MANRIWTVPYNGTITAAGGNTDLWTILPADDHPIRLRGIRFAQTTELGDAAEENPRISVLRMSATVTNGSGGASGTPISIDLHATLPGFTARVNDTTVATTSGTTEIIEELAWNERATPFEIWYPDPDFAPKAIQTQALLIRVQDTLADDLTFAGTVWIEEL